jgi:hypothetical protein
MMALTIGDHFECALSLGSLSSLVYIYPNGVIFYGVLAKGIDG